jgi:hypothetical protein
MVEAGQIRDVVADYMVHGDGNRFVLAFSVLSYNIHRKGSDEAVILADRIEFLMADLNLGCLSKLQFVEALNNL